MLLWQERRYLIDLVNAVFGAFNQPLIKALTVLNPSLDPDHDGDKTAILDIRAVTLDGHGINVEMQMVDSGNFLRQMLYYWAELYGETLHAGQDQNICSSNSSFLPLAIPESYSTWLIRTQRLGRPFKC